MQKSRLAMAMLSATSLAQAIAMAPQPTVTTAAPPPPTPPREPRRLFHAPRDRDLRPAEIQHERMAAAAAKRARKADKQRALAARGVIGALPPTTPRGTMQHGQTENATPDFGAAINEQFRQFCAQQADLLIQNHGIVRAGVIVAIDGNGYISVASFGTSPTGVNMLLADALALNQSRQPDVEARLMAGQTLNELATATPEHAATQAADAPVLALEADAAEPAEGARTVDAAPTQH